MIRSICLISQEYPPDTAFGGIARVVDMAARSLANAGIAVHVITQDPTGQGRTLLSDGVVVHRLAMPPIQLPPDMPYVSAGVWSQVVAQKYAELDALVHFDLVQAQDYGAEALHLNKRPETPLVIALHAPMSLIARYSGWPRTPGQRALDAVELTALGKADAIVAPTQLVLDEIRSLVGSDLPPAHVLAPAFDAQRFRPRVRNLEYSGSIELLFVGRLEALKSPDLAMRALAAAKHRGLNVRLTLLGRDVTDASGRSTRREILLPLAQQLGLEFGDFRFVEQRDEAGVIQHLHNSDCVILPSRFENLHTAAIEALATGVPAITGRRSGLRHWVSDDDGVRTIPTENAEAFAEAAADALSDRRWLIEAGGRGRRRVTEVFEPENTTRRHLELYEQLVGTAKPGAIRSGARAVEGPELAVIILAHNALSYTKRCVQSLIAHTQTPLRIYLVDNGSTDGTAEWAGKVGDPLTLIRSEVNLGVSGGRNVGLKSIIGTPEYIVFLDNDVEVMTGWWQPFAGALAANRDVAIAGERGVILEFHREGRTERPLIGPGPQDADMAIGFCMFMRPSAVRQIGSFDENLGLFWHDDDDFGLRARRLGYRVLHMATGRILHFEHKSSSTLAEIWNAPEKPSELSDRNQRYLRDKYSVRHGALRDARAFVVLAIADEVLESPRLLQAYADRFSAADDVTLVIYAPDRNPHEVQMMLEPVLVAAGLDSDEAADIVAVPVPSSRDHEIILAQSVDAVLSGKDPAGVFHSPPHFAASEIHQLRDLARRRLNVVGASSAQLSEPAAA